MSRASSVSGHGLYGAKKIDREIGIAEKIPRLSREVGRQSDKRVLAWQRRLQGWLSCERGLSSLDMAGDDMDTCSVSRQTDPPDRLVPTCPTRPKAAPSDEWKRTSIRQADPYQLVPPLASQAGFTMACMTHDRGHDKRPSDKRPSDKRPSDKRPSDKRPSDKRPSAAN